MEHSDLKTSATVMKKKNLRSDFNRASPVIGKATRLRALHCWGAILNHVTQSLSFANDPVFMRSILLLNPSCTQCAWLRMRVRDPIHLRQWKRTSNI